VSNIEFIFQHLNASGTEVLDTKCAPGFSNSINRLLTRLDEIHDVVQTLAPGSTQLAQQNFDYNKVVVICSYNSNGFTLEVTSEVLLTRQTITEIINWLTDTTGVLGGKLND